MSAIRYKEPGNDPDEETIQGRFQSSMSAIRYKEYLWKPLSGKGSRRENRSSIKNQRCQGTMVWFYSCTTSACYDILFSYTTTAAQLSCILRLTLYIHYNYLILSSISGSQKNELRFHHTSLYGSYCVRVPDMTSRMILTCFSICRRKLSVLPV